MPLIPFLVAQANGIDLNADFVIATISIAVFFLFVLGFSKSFVTSISWYYTRFITNFYILFVSSYLCLKYNNPQLLQVYSAGETIFIGAISAGAAYGVGALFGFQE
eukprot:GHVR01127216.1.p1 GENE.GHVR01127216.1~~GHVR01127216.1.p1  ORF type:complete len:106 (+),score=0.96 GHVR01127216.1:351-668(+)